MNSPTKARPHKLATVDAVRGAAEELLARISEADAPAEIVAAASPMDLVAALREADDEQRVELLALMDREQIAVAVDVACWKGDAFDPGKLAALLSPAIATGIDAASRLFHALDNELRTLLLKPYVVVHLREDRNEEFQIADGSEFFECADGMYAIELPQPEDAPQAIRQIIAALMYRPFAEYQLELECLRHDLPSELEEAALRWRTGRLADLGYSPREEGLAALAPEDPKALRERIRGTSAAPRVCDEIALPTLYARCLDGAPLLDAALERIATSRDPACVERAGTLPAEIGAAVALFLSGAGVELGDLEAVTRGVRLARDTLALGLGVIADGDVALAAAALLRAAPISFVRVGMGVLAPLRERARALQRKLRVANAGRPGVALDPPHAVTVELLGRGIPQRFPPLEAGDAASPAPLSPLAGEITGFAELAHVARAEALLAEAELVPDLLARLGALDRASALPAGAAASTALLTALANTAAGRALLATPVTAEEASDLEARALRAGVEAFIAEAFGAAAAPLGLAPAGEMHPELEADPRRRLVLRLLLIGFSRLEGGARGEAIAVADQSTR